LHAPDLKGGEPEAARQDASGLHVVGVEGYMIMFE
jgi:hypothetical protein